MDSELRQKLLQLRPPSADPDNDNDFENETGINIERDIDTVVAALGSGSAANAHDRALVVARGRFDQPRIEGLIRQRGGRVESYKGQSILTVTHENRPFGLSFVEADVVVVGSAADVRRAIDTKLGVSAGVTDNDQIMSLVRDARDGNAWAVGRFGALARARLPENIGVQLPPINWFAASGRINGGVEGVVRAEADSDQAATDLRDVIRGFMVLARLQAGQSKELTSMLSAVQLSGEGRMVSLAFSLPPELIDALTTMHRRRLEQRPSNQAAR
jgi:hypothetical protein